MTRGRSLAGSRLGMQSAARPCRWISLPTRKRSRRPGFNASRVNLQVRLHDFLPESKHVRIAGVDGRADPVGVGVAEGRYSGEVLDDALLAGADERLVDAEDVRVAVDVDHGLPERQGFLLQRGEEGVVAGLSAARRRLHG